QDAIRNDGAVESFKYAQENPAKAARLAPVLGNYRRRFRWRGCVDASHGSMAHVRPLVCRESGQYVGKPSIAGTVATFRAATTRVGAAPVVRGHRPGFRPAVRAFRRWNGAAPGML